MTKEILTTDDERITVAEAATILRMSPMGLRVALRHGKFSYFGEAWKSDDEGDRWTYYICQNRFLEYVGMAEARGVDLPEIQNYLQRKAQEPSPAESFSLLEKADLEKEIKKLKSENKKLKGIINRFLEEASEVVDK